MSAGRKSFLIFTLSGARYAFDLSQVAEVIEQTDTWPIPLAPDYYRGAMNFHGSIVAVMDLGDFLRQPGDTGQEKIIVAHPAIAALAFAVESVSRIIPLGPNDWTVTASGQPFVSGRLNLPDGTATLLDMAAIAGHAAETING